MHSMSGHSKLSGSLNNGHHSSEQFNHTQANVRSQSTRTDVQPADGHASIASLSQRTSISQTTNQSSSTRSILSESSVNNRVNGQNSPGTSRASNHVHRLHSSSRNIHDITTTSTLFPTNVIMSIVEGRGKAKGEVGLAYIDLDSPTLHLAQFRDNCSFDSLKMKCHACLPVEIIFPNTLTGNSMILTLNENFPGIDFKEIDRRFFNEKKGFEYVKTLCCKHYTGIDIELESKYYALLACSALLVYISTEKQIQYTSKSLKIDFQSSFNTMIIDPISAKMLELLINLSNPKSTDTLFGVINRTKTKTGYLLLRSAILQPSTDLELITKRLNMVEVIASSIETFNYFEMVLTNFSLVDLDQLLVYLAHDSSFSTVSLLRIAEKKIDFVLQIKHVISLVDQLRQTLESCNSPIFEDYIELLKDENFVNIRESIDKMIVSESKYAKGVASMKMEKCFAIKERINSLLDLARGLYSEGIDDISALCRAYETKFQIGEFKLGFTSAKGYYLQIKRNSKEPLFKMPELFCDVHVSKNCISFTSEDMMKLNNRVMKSMEEVYLQSDITITDLINDIRGHIGCLHVLTDIVANVDLVFSFAYQCSCSNYIRPNFGDYIEIQNGTHPLLDKISISVANTMLITNDLNFAMLTGPNMSGKTTFLKQLALLQIMAQIGSFVPAEQATFRICDKIFTRMGFNDNLQMNSSSFTVEIKELNYILTNLTPNCLILIDELGRGSVFNKTLPVYWAICESLLSSKAYTVFATHFIELTSLAKVYLNVTNYHFSSEIVEGNLVCKYPHILLPGPTLERFYGIELARQSGLEPAIVEDARDIAIRFSANTAQANSSEQIIRRAKYRLVGKLMHLIINKQEKLDIDLIRRLQCEFEEMKQIESLYE